MAVVKRGITKWGEQVSYDPAPVDNTAKHPDLKALREWLHAGIAEFNRRVGRSIWIPIDDLTGHVGPFVRFRYIEDGSSESPIGRQQMGMGQPQEVKYRHRPAPAPYLTLHHEMGHCLGLGHENFHPEWPWWSGINLINIVQKAVEKTGLPDDAKFSANNWEIARFVESKQNGYDRAGDFDPASIMLYTGATFAGVKTEGKAGVTEAFKVLDYARRRAGQLLTEDGSRLGTALKANLETALKAAESFTDGNVRNGVLSDGDCAAIQRLYPQPPPT